MGEVVLPEAFYRRKGAQLFESTPATAGPWSPHAQHGGPPSALLGSALEEAAAAAGFRVARVTLELPGPVPIADLEVRVRPIHTSRRTLLLEGELVADGKVVLFGRAWAMTAGPSSTPVLAPELTAPPLPETQPAKGMRGAFNDGYLSAMEWRFAPGHSFNADGPGAVWARQRIPLIDDTPDTTTTRVLTLADANWGVAGGLDLTKHFAINTDITVAITREPVGEWLCMHSAITAGPDGSGLATGQLYDLTAHCGTVLQTLFLAEPR